jgi:tetratricopeptide (TPR) repeat protein
VSLRERRVRRLATTALEVAARNEHDEALRLLDEAIDVARRLPLSVLADQLHLRAFVLGEAGRDRQCVEAARLAIDVRSAVEAPSPHDIGALADTWETLSIHLLRLDDHEGAATALDRADALRSAPDTDPADVTRGLLNRVALLQRQGRMAEARAAALELVRVTRDRGLDAALADPGFASALVNVAVALRFSGHWREALSVMAHAVTELRIAAIVDPALEPDLAAALDNQSLMLMETGDPAGGLVPGEEALRLREMLAGRLPAVHEADLTASLLNQSVLLGKVGRHDESIALSARCVELRRRALARRRDADQAPLANALASAAWSRVIAGRPAEALPLVAEARELWDALLARDPVRHRRFVAAFLDTEASVHDALGRTAEVLAVQAELLEHVEVLLAENREGYGDLCAELLLESARRHERMEDPTGALTHASTAVDLLTELSAEQAEAHAARLAEARELRDRVAARS